MNSLKTLKACFFIVLLYRVLYRDRYEEQIILNRKINDTRDISRIDLDISKCRNRSSMGIYVIQSAPPELPRLISFLR